MTCPSLNLSVSCKSNCFKCLPRVCSCCSKNNNDIDHNNKAPKEQRMTEDKVTKIVNEAIKKDHEKHDSEYTSHHKHRRHKVHHLISQKTYTLPSSPR